MARTTTTALCDSHTQKNFLLPLSSSPRRLTDITQMARESFQAGLLVGALLCAVLRTWRSEGSFAGSLSYLESVNSSLQRRESAQWVIEPGTAMEKSTGALKVAANHTSTNEAAGWCLPRLPRPQISGR